MVCAGRHWRWLGSEPNACHSDCSKCAAPRYHDQNPADFRISATARYADHVNYLRDIRAVVNMSGRNGRTFLSLANLAVQVKPTPLLAHEAAYFMQAVSTSINFIPCDEFDDGVIRIATFVAFNI